MRLSIFAVAALLLLSGCNTWLEKTYQKITVRTPGVENANCTLYTEKLKYVVFSSYQVYVERSPLPITIECEKAGYYTASAFVKPVISDPGASLNVVNGFLPGMLYDVADNSVYAYPDTIIVMLLPKPPQELPQEPAPFVVEKKSEPVKPMPLTSAPPAEAADKSLSASGKK